MELTRSSLPSVVELGDTFSESIGLEYGTGESNGIITSVTIDRTDPGVTLDYDSSSVTIHGRYESQFDHSISWAAPQNEDHDPPVFTTDISWGPVPEPGNPAIWYVYAYRPPPEQSKTVTLTISGTYSQQGEATEPPAPPPETVHNIPFSFSIEQTVLYDLDANVEEFKRYI